MGTGDDGGCFRERWIQAAATGNTFAKLELRLHAMTRMNISRAEDPEPLPPPRGFEVLLPDHHRCIDARSRELLAGAYADDSRELVVRWSELETELRDHVAAEEEIILPSYSKYAPVNAKRIRDEHARILALMTPIGIEVELHEVRASRLATLVTALAAHSAYEDTTMYPWAALNLPLLSQRMLFVRIGRWLSRT